MGTLEPLGRSRIRNFGGEICDVSDKPPASPYWTATPLRMPQIALSCPPGLQEHDSQLHPRRLQPLVSLFAAQTWLAAVT